MASQTLSSEVLVIGSGPGGAVSAYELQKSGRQVTLVDEGVGFEQRSTSAYSLQELVSAYRNGGVTATIGRPAIKYVEASCLGGGSEVNSGLYYRTPDGVVDRWRDRFSVDDFTVQLLEPHFAECERRINVCPMPGKPPELSLKLLEGAERLGWRCDEIPRWFKYSDKPDPLPADGVRQSMSETYLPAFVAVGGEIRDGIKISRVQKIRGGWRAIGRRRDAAEVTIDAPTIVLSAGAIQTPAMLRRSGFRTNVGNSLKVHATAKVVARFDSDVNSRLSGVGVHQVREFAPTMSFGCAVSSAAYLRVALLDNPDFQEDISQTWKSMASYYAMICGGRGRIRSMPITGDAIVSYKLGRQEMIDLALGLKRLTKLLIRAGAVGVYPGYKGATVIRDESELHRLPNMLDRSRANLMTIHLMGSCPMGEDRSTTSVDSFGQVHGAPGLYVSDASLIAEELGVNPQGTVMALARRNAHHILEKS